MVQYFGLVVELQFVFVLNLSPSEPIFLIVGFGSVSGLLGRKINSIYAGAKRALESYFESLAFDENFKTIMKWNRSLFFGIAVGTLSDMIEYF